MAAGAITLLQRRVLNLCIFDNFLDACMAGKAEQLAFVGEHVNVLAAVRIMAL